MNLQIIALTVMLVSTLGVTVGITLSRCSKRAGDIIIYGLSTTTVISLGVLVLIALGVL